MSAPAQIFLGQVMHRRLRPKVNAFVYPVFFLQISLRRLAEANCGIFAVDRSNPLICCEMCHQDACSSRNQWHENQPLCQRMVERCCGERDVSSTYPVQSDRCFGAQKFGLLAEQDGFWLTC